MCLPANGNGRTFGQLINGSHIRFGQGLELSQLDVASDS